MRLPAPADLRELATLVPRLLRLVIDAEELVLQVRQLIARIEESRQEVDHVIARADATATRASALVLLAEPPVLRVLPLLERVTEMVDPADVDTIASLIESLPNLASTAGDDVLPVLGSLSSVAPDLRDLLVASKELNEMLGKLPGMGRVKKRIEEEQTESSEGPGER